MKGFWKSGDPFIWLTGGALAVNLILVAGLVLLILVNGLGFFWPRALIRLELRDGGVVLGQVAEREAIPDPDGGPGAPVRHRLKINQGNRDLLGADFVWVDESAIVARRTPAEAVLIERTEWGNLIGVLKEVLAAGGVVASGPEASWEALRRRLPETLRTARRIRRIERREIGAINFRQEELRLRLRGLEMKGTGAGPEVGTIRAGMTVLETAYAGAVTRSVNLPDFEIPEE